MPKNPAQKKKSAPASSATVAVDLEKTPEVLPAPETILEPSSFNVARRERIASGLIGGGLLMYGVPNFLTLPGQLSNVAGVYMLARGITGRCPIYSALGIDTSPYGRLHHLGPADPHPVQLRQTISTFRSPLEVYEFCRDQAQVARCFSRVKEVQKLSETRSTWIFSDRAELVKIPVTVEITQDIEGEQLGWSAFPESRYRIDGTLQFKAGPHNQETEIISSVHMVPPAGLLGAQMMKWLSPISTPAMNEALHKMKQLLETGAITKSESSILEGIRGSLGSWQNRFKSHLQVRTMQSLASRGIS